MTSPPAVPPARATWRYPALFFAIHVSIALLARAALGVEVSRRYVWDWFQANIPVEHVRSGLWESIWYLHAQPPLSFLLYGGIFIRGFHPDHDVAIHLVNILLGGAVAGMTFTIAEATTKSRRLAIGVAALAAAPPFVAPLRSAPPLRTAGHLRGDAVLLSAGAPRPEPRLHRLARWLSSWGRSSRTASTSATGCPSSSSPGASCSPSPGAP
jgi:hypothetical protein